MNTLRTFPRRARRPARGASLIVVMIIIVIVSVLGISAAQIAAMGEHGARNDRDLQVAFQSAEAALHDATNDMEGVGTTPRGDIFAPGNKVDFLEGCGTSGVQQGLCALEVADGAKPIWLQVDLAGSSSPAATFGQFTGSTFAAGSPGIRPAQAPRYLVEVIDDKFRVGNDKSLTPMKNMLYRVTAMGFGPRADTQAVVQMLYSKE